MKLEAKDIKLERVREDEYTTRYYYNANTKYLKERIYATKHYGYNVYNEEGRLLTDRSEYLYTLKDVKEWIASYDEREEVKLKEKAEEDAYRENEYIDLKAEETRLLEEFVSDTDIVPVIEVGDMLAIRLGNFSKPCNMGESLSNMRQDSLLAEVVNVTNLSTEEFDTASKDLYNCFNGDWLLKGGNVGGVRVDDDGTKTELINIITADNRKPMVVNSEGYDYPRYTGIVV